MLYAAIGDQRRSLGYFRRLLDRHPDKLDEITRLFTTAKNLQRTIDDQPGFAEQLVAACPELFDASSGGGAAAQGTEE